ncbi:MAG: phosphoenolpyruvate carboxylase [Gemmatimonadaceae bacterium]
MPRNPDTRPEDVPLHDDVRLLAAGLGSVIQRLEGDEAYRVVDDLRRACKSRRRGAAGARDLDALIDETSRLPLDVAAVTARAFTLFFLLINTAEQVHRVRRRRAYLGDGDLKPQPASATWTMQRLREKGISAEEVGDALATLDVRPVLTAHPTESTRRTVLTLQARVADLLLEREHVFPSDRAAIDESLEAEIELLWLTAEVRRDRPSVGDEVSTVLWYLETRLLDASARANASLVRAFEQEFGVPRDDLHQSSAIRIGTWVGGDRDGNPFVTPATTIAASRRASYVILGRYRSWIDELVRRLSLSAQITPPSDELEASLLADRALLPDIWAANARRNEDEPVRLKLTFIAARVAATLAIVAARDAGHSSEFPAAYAEASDLLGDLLLVHDSLELAGAIHAQRTVINPLLAAIRTYGFHGMMMDVRDHADSHREALEEIASAVGHSPFDEAGLRQELRGRRPLIGTNAGLSESTRRVVDTFAAISAIQAETGPDAISTYIVSMTRNSADLLRVLLLARESGLVDLAGDAPRSSIDVVPLFETLSDLENAPEVMRELLADPVYQRQLAARGNRQEVMIGYSDSGKDAGIIASSWGLYRGQELLVPIFRQAGVTLRLFHGRGGSVGRGGGSPVYRALAALPPDSVDGRIKITEQGEIISQQFGLLPIAERTLEVTLSGVLLQRFTDWRDHVSESDVMLFRQTMEELSTRSLERYRATAHENPALFEMFEKATPIAELASARFGSRPAYRPGASGGIDGIRAIPWVFGWTQNRLMLPGWLGVGSSLSEFAATPGGLDVLQRMAKKWPFFDDLLAKIEMVCAKADVDITRAYVSRLGGDLQLLEQLIEEFKLTIATLMKIRGADHLLDDSVVVQAAIALRNPYVDALSLLQINQLLRKRAAPPSEEEMERIESVLATTVSGIAQGLRNTG